MGDKDTQFWIYIRNIIKIVERGGRGGGDRGGEEEGSIKEKAMGGIITGIRKNIKEKNENKVEKNKDGKNKNEENNHRKEMEIK